MSERPLPPKSVRPPVPPGTPPPKPVVPPPVTDDKRVVTASNERARWGSRPRSEPRSPDYQVLMPYYRTTARWPILVFPNGQYTAVDLAYTESNHKDPLPVRIFTDRADPLPSVTIDKRTGWSITETVIHDGRGAVVCQVRSPRLRSLWRTRFTVTGQQGTPYHLVERKRDIVWRRVWRPLASVTDGDGAPDLFGAIMFACLRPLFAIKLRSQLRITDPAGTQVGVVSLVSILRRPREDFSIYLTERRTTDADRMLLPAVIAALRVMH